MAFCAHFALVSDRGDNMLLPAHLPSSVCLQQNKELRCELGALRKIVLGGARATDYDAVLAACQADRGPFGFTCEDSCDSTGCAAT